MMTPDVNTMEKDLPVSIAGYTVLNSDDSYTIILNARLTFERRMAAYKHELQHICHGDYHRKSDVDILEFYSHEYL